MRSEETRQELMLLGITADQLVPADHPIRRVRVIVDRALASLSPTFSQMYARDGRESIPPEHLLKANLLIDLYSTRSERQFCERLQSDLLFKRFLDLNISDRVFDASAFSDAMLAEAYRQPPFRPARHDVLAIAAGEEPHRSDQRSRFLRTRRQP